ncbi:hypothetical protein PP419_gp11 [Microbacterium phage vB_MoxS-R1]|uniref:Uncharacterized protein n=2 Tax=root TaxID=1 RepID=A0A8F2IVC0_9CAUD|nr:hypothetical protein PP419_gp11 [Microbacterium phage vB_MoxS-R1]QWT28861.1 hypothetical protein vBMoxSR1_gp11 [Microbacterium phage vB_MoxS-R1]
MQERRRCAMSNAARKARKRAGVKFEHKAKIPTGRSGKPYYGLPVLPLGVLDFAREIWESRSFR